MILAIPGALCAQDTPANTPPEQVPANPEGSESAPDQQPASQLNRSNPQATMATFLNAIDEAQRGQVARFTNAIACLDLAGLSDLPPEVRQSQARKLASQLNEFLDEHHVELELIPSDAEGGPYTYPEGKIEITRSDEGLWLFTWSSLEFVRDLPADAPAAAVAATPNGDAKPAESTPAEPAAVAQLTSVPAQFRSARATLRTFRDAMRENRIADAAQCLDLSDFQRVIRNEKGVDYAVLLHEAINRTKLVVAQDFSDDPGANPHIFRQDALGIIVIARQLAGADRAGAWLFTKETVAGLDALYENLLAAGAETQDGSTTQAPFNLSLWLRNHIPDPLKQTWFLMQHWQWIGLLTIFALGMVVHRVTTALLQIVTRLWLRRCGVSVDDRVQLNSLRPLGILAGAAVWWLGLTWLGLPAEVLTVLLAAVKFIACWATVWTVYRAVDLLGDYFMSLASTTETKTDDLLVPFARKVAKTLITLFGIVFIVEQFMDGKPTELLAGLGLGGLALALAAQDSLKNLFGSLTIIVDRPFKVGDWVVVGAVEGTVETVGFRSTRVRTFYHSVVTVPNSILMSATVDNYGARRYRRARTMLSITYSTPPEKIDAFCEGIRELIRLHPHTRKDYYHVYFNQFAASSLDILLYVFFEVPDWSTELRERHRLFVDIVRLAHRLGVEFAFPTQSVWLERAKDRADESSPVTIMPGRDDPDQAGVDIAGKLFHETYGVGSERRAPVVIETRPRFQPSQPPSSDHGPA